MSPRPPSYCQIAYHERVSKMHMRGYVRLVVAVLLVALFASSCTGSGPDSPRSPAGFIVGQVVGLGGEPVRDAKVTAGGSNVRTDERGGFAISSASPGSWVTVTHPGYLSRTRAGAPGDPLLVRLTPDDGETVALHFGGDVMMGRRFFDLDEDGDRNDAVLDDPADVAAHRALLEPLAPLLANADLTAVNVESPISARPYLDPTQPRQPGVHPTKDFVFASGPALPSALAQAGVDVVGLANNHQYDLLEEGAYSTVEAFARAGFGPGTKQFGLGASIDAAYVPAITEVGGMRIAFLGCTTITGSEHVVGYVAQVTRGGAAPCEETRVRDAVAAAAAVSDLVVFSVHGGFDYARESSAKLQMFAMIAREAGAKLVVNHHPHVVGGLDWDGSGLTAWSLGNLVFDQSVWPTFQSYVLAVHVRRGEIIRAYLEPMMIDEYVAHGVNAGLADYVARTAAGVSRGPFVVEDGAVELDLGGRSRPRLVRAELTGSQTGRIAEIGDGWLLEQADSATSQFGTDLMWVGDFEDDVLADGPGALWTEEVDNQVVLDPAPDRGYTYQLRRDDGNEDPVVSSPIHRILLTNPGSVGLRRATSQLDDEDPAATAPPAAGPTRADAQVSLTGLLRMDPGARVEVQLSWYPDTRGPSSSQTVHTAEGGADGTWQPLRLDAAVPPDAVAVGVFVRLWPPVQLAGQPPPPPPSEVTAGLDRVRLIEWSPQSTTASPRGATHIRSFADGSAQLSRVGAPDGSAPPPIEELPG